MLVSRQGDASLDTENLILGRREWESIVEMGEDPATETDATVLVCGLSLLQCGDLWGSRRTPLGLDAPSVPSVGLSSSKQDPWWLAVSPAAEEASPRSGREDTGSPRPSRGCRPTRVLSLGWFCRAQPPPTHSGGEYTAQ